MITDSEALTRKADSLEGELELESSERLVDQLAEPFGQIKWQLRGYRHAPVGRPEEQWLELSLKGRTHLPCIRCLQATEVNIDAHFRYLLVEDETQAALLDEQTDEHDVLVGSTHFPVTELVEDEVLMALPPLAMHEQCPAELPGTGSGQAGREDDSSERPNPFAVLSKLKVL